MMARHIIAPRRKPNTHAAATMINNEDLNSLGSGSDYSGKIDTIEIDYSSLAARAYCSIYYRAGETADDKVTTAVAENLTRLRGL